MTTTIECVVCFDDLTSNSQVALGCCSARTCRSCVQRLPRCPQCRAEFPTRDNSQALKIALDNVEELEQREWDLHEELGEIKTELAEVKEDLRLTNMDVDDLQGEVMSLLHNGMSEDLEILRAELVAHKLIINDLVNLSGAMFIVSMLFLTIALLASF